MSRIYNQRRIGAAQQHLRATARLAKWIHLRKPPSGAVWVGGLLGQPIAGSGLSTAQTHDKSCLKATAAKSAWTGAAGLHTRTCDACWRSVAETKSFPEAAATVCKCGSYSLAGGCMASGTPSKRALFISRSSRFSAVTSLNSCV
ncbi:hypothetical protein HPB49_007828 [Dermacentor silvarum]|uniref:Uncharacterized protein n=1 Tax=Dermacentor silvarum TaxID=543639 RepID=A0ACB8C2K9_DERSI|nr:hypothetical protein HPB49_007828 [Dermacentor silvarum]